MSKFIGICLIALATTTVANAFPIAFDHHGGRDQSWNSPASAPEIDPASAASGLTLLAGGLMVLRGRRSNKK